MCATPKKEMELARWHGRHNLGVMDLHSTGPERICVITDDAWARKNLTWLPTQGEVFSSVVLLSISASCCGGS